MDDAALSLFHTPGFEVAGAERRLIRVNSCLITFA